MDDTIGQGSRLAYFSPLLNAAAFLNSSTFRKYLPYYASPPEFELYDLQEDPNLLINLADNPDYQMVLEKMKERLLQWRINTADPLLDPEYRAMLTERYRGETRYIPANR
jgi:N-sulfoglucosamine sulfohydrolase